MLKLHRLPTLIKITDKFWGFELVYCPGVQKTYLVGACYLWFIKNRGAVANYVNGEICYTELLVLVVSQNYTEALLTKMLLGSKIQNLKFLIWKS